MSDVPGTVTRAQLYEAVWAHPMRDIAKAFGLKGGVVARLCSRFRVPIPPPGYWQRIRAGEKVRRPPLSATAELPQDAVVPFPASGGGILAGALLSGGLDTAAVPSIMEGRMGQYERNRVPGMQSEVVITEEVEGLLASAPYGLTQREIQVLRYLFDDKTSREIGLTLGISPRTVEVHRASMLVKTRTHGTITLVKLVIALSTGRSPS